MRAQSNAAQHCSTVAVSQALKIVDGVYLSLSKLTLRRTPRFGFSMGVKLSEHINRIILPPSSHRITCSEMQANTTMTTGQGFQRRGSFYTKVYSYAYRSTKPTPPTLPESNPHTHMHTHPGISKGRDHRVHSPIEKGDSSITAEERGMVYRSSRGKNATKRHTIIVVDYY